ncbi:MAG: heavy metal translocating P-type ATPase [Saprospiraceae bacterium]
MGNTHDHHHESGLAAVFGERTELYFAVVAGIFWLTGLVFELSNTGSELLHIGLFAVAIVAGGVFPVIETWQGLRARIFDIDFLMLVAAAGAIALGRWGEAALLLFLFSLGHALEHYAMGKARKSISALADLTPPTAMKKSGGAWLEVAAEDLEIGDRLLVKPNSKIPADGYVIEGTSAVDQAAITGESVPVEKSPLASTNSSQLPRFESLVAEHQTFAGTINGSGALEVIVLRKSADTTLSQLVRLVEEAEDQKSPTQLFTDKIQKYYVPAVLLVVALLNLAFLVLDESFGESFYRAMAVLVAASPCALAISTPSAVLAGVARAARGGVLVKGGGPLELLSQIQAIAFDKTGTLTEGKPTLTSVSPFGKTTEQELLRIAVAIERGSDHHLAAAIVKGGEARLGDLTIPEVKHLKALTARGVQADVDETTYYLGNRRLFEEVTRSAIPEALDETMLTLEQAGNTAMLVGSATSYLGVIGVMDVARTEAKAAIKHLSDLGISRTVMLTGDHQLVANAIAKEVGISDPLGGLLPEEKVAAIERLREELGEVAMVGDGVNDAPAMARSSVGIAMGSAGSDVALQTADIALMGDRLDRLPWILGLSRKAHRIIQQNLWISLGMVAILVPLTLLGIAEIGPAVIGHEGSTIVVVLNALRLLGYKD